MGDSLKLREGLLRRSWASGAARADRRSESDTGLVSETKETVETVVTVRRSVTKVNPCVGSREMSVCVMMTRANREVRM